MSDFLTILFEKVRLEPDRSEPTFAGVYRYFLKVYHHDETAAKDAMVMFMSGQLPPAVIADLDAFRSNDFGFPISTVSSEMDAGSREEKAPKQ
jgi:hypothetical protein